MKYNYHNISIPKEKRGVYNEKLLTLIRLGDMQTISREDVFNAYTGIGGLHGLDYKDFNSYHEYAEGKKAYEQGQFFTPPPICKSITDLFPISNTDLCADLSFGMGGFFNALPNESAIYGTEIDANAYVVAKFLYPNASLENRDIRSYEPSIKFDYIFGNPPFNLRWQIGDREMSSQDYYCEKSYQLLKPMGVLALIVPLTWLADSHFYSGLIEKLNKQFSFLCQYELPKSVQRNYGTDFPVKVLIFSKHSNHYISSPYTNNSVTYDKAQELINLFIQSKSKLRAKLSAESAISTNAAFLYKVNKYLYEIKTHKILQPYYAKSLAYTQSLKEQVIPKWITDIKNYDEQQKEWNKIRVTENKVLAYLRRVMSYQDKTPIDKSEWVKTKYGVKLKSYSNKESKANESIKVKYHSFNTAIIEDSRHYITTQKLLSKKTNAFNLANKPLQSLERNDAIDTYLRSFTFNKATENGVQICRFNAIQFNDLGLILQKPYAALNWSPGCGKTAAGYAWAKYQKVRNVFIISPAVSINLTWRTFLEIQNQSFVQIKSLSDINSIKLGQFVIISTEMLVRYKKHIRKYVKKQAKKVAVIFDESDEMTNRGSKRTKAAIDCFKDVKRKLLTTGTLTRNKISEIYAQLEFLYNNSINMLCTCENYYEEKKVDHGFEISEYENPYYNTPFNARHGHSLFSACFNPSKATVFGIRKQNQDIYNESSLRSLIEKTIITRRFKEVAGDKYTIHNINVYQNDNERNVYRKIVNELYDILPSHFSSTGNSRKDSMLRIIQQLNLLISATSMPQLIKGYDSAELPNKAKKILSMVGKYNERIAIGCISLQAVENYRQWIADKYPNRELFVIKGDVTFKQRERLIKDLGNSNNGILICTQQSLRASVNIPFVNVVIVEAKQWNIPKMEQWFFRFIRYDSLEHTNVFIISYKDTIEMNLLALLMAKERLNDYIKTLDFKGENEMYEEFGVDLDILDSIMSKEKDSEGRTVMSWGKQNVNI